MSLNKVLLVLMTTMVSVSWAGQEPYIPKNIDDQFVKNIQEQKRVAEALFELEQIQKKRSDLIKQNSETSSDISTNNQVRQPSVPSLNWPVNAAKPEIEPIVLSIEGKAGNLRAMLLVGRGATQRVKSGNTANGWKVIKVEHDGVLASKDGKAKFLAFGDSNYVPQESNSQSANQPFDY
ncbi:type IV pilus biogenesis protein PilP [Thiomicrospira sp.]|uniref:type IV pilus biogenesis protein PilP n=1 Tax=Thiomicrospira sp. TaxID=935 RepID=UPI002F92BB86